MNNTFEKIKEVVQDAEINADKFFNTKNASAGSRLRAQAQVLKVLCQELRTEVQSIKNAGK